MFMEAEMVRFDPNALYSRNDLEEMLRGVVGVDVFLKRLGLSGKRVFRDAVWGWEILEAARKAPPFTEKAETPDLSEVLSARTGKKKAGATRVGRLTADDVSR
jgi:hypothetical protein